MKINFDRLSQLAGISSGSKRSLNESAHYTHEGDYTHEGSAIDGLEEESAIAGLEEEDVKDSKLDEMIEVDEVMLVQELRRMKNIMESKKRQKVLNKKRAERRKQALVEAKLKQVIDDEVKDILNQLNYSSSWVYGNNKPQRSRHGYSHQGSYLKGLGFK